MKLNAIMAGSFLVVALVPFFFIGYFTIDTQIITQMTQSLNHESQEIFLIKDYMDSLLRDAESDVLFLSGIHELTKLINSNNRVDREEFKLDVQKDFLTFSKNNIYYQLRYIDENGQEIIRIDNGGSPYIVPEEELQNKKGRYYFEDAMNARKGTVFVSPLDLNIEGGELENRGTEEEPIYVPVIRYATPVFNDQNEPKGIIIANIYADYFLEVARRDIEGEILTMVNKEGFYLVHPNQSKEWGFMLDRNETLQNDYEVEILSETIHHLEEPEVRESRLDVLLAVGGISIKESKDYFILHTHIWPSGNESLSSTGSNKAYTQSVEKIQGKDYYWTLLIVLEKDYLLAPIIKQRNNTLIVGLIILVIIVISSFFISRSITKPIIKLRDATVNIGKGKLNVPIKIKSRNNEVKDLINSSENMRINLKKSRAQLVEKEKLEKAYSALGKSNKLKDLFIDIMRHDLINPAGIAQMNADIALQGEKDVKKREALSRTSRSSKGVIDLIKSASTLSKLEEGQKLEFKKEDLGVILNTVVDESKHLADVKKMKLNADIKGKFPAIINSLVQDVFANLISNAIKYGPEKTEIYIGIKAIGDKYRISVADKGKGIPHKFKKAIFERFTRLEKGAIEGSGLGLAIAKKVAELHHGKIWVVDHKGGGSIFIFEIPPSRK